MNMTYRLVWGIQGIVSGDNHFMCTLSHLHTAAPTADPIAPSTITAVADSSLKLSCVLQGSPPDDARWGNGRVNYAAMVTSVIHNSVSC